VAGVEVLGRWRLGGCDEVVCVLSSSPARCLAQSQRVSHSSLWDVGCGAS
jgi:hypothetical protein